MAIELAAAAGDASTPPRIRGLRCRNCGTPEAIGPSYVCAACFGPLEVDVDLELVGGLVTPAAIAGRPTGHLALPRAPAGRGPARARAQGRQHAAGPRGPARRVDRRRGAADQGRHPQPDAVVQGSGGRDRRGPARLLRPRGARLREHRQPRRRDGGGRRRDRRPGLRVRARRPRAGQDRARARLRRDRRADRRHLRRRQPPVPRGRRRAAVGPGQRQPPPVLRRGQQDARLRDRRGPRLAAARRRRGPDRVGRDGHPARAGVRGAGRARLGRGQSRSGSSAGRPPAARRSPRRSPPAAWTSSRSGRRTRSCARWRSATPPTGATRWSWRGRPRGRSRRSPTSRRRTRSGGPRRSRASTPRPPAA